MAEGENITTELDIVKKMAELMKGLDEDGKRRALWYLADLAGLSQRATAAPMQPQAGQMPMGQARRAPVSMAELNTAMTAASQRAKEQAARGQAIGPDS